MVFESLLATDSLLTMIVGLMTINKFDQSRIKGLMASTNRHLKTLRSYFAEDIRIRNRLEKKANMILDKQGVDIHKLDTAINIDTDINLRVDLEDLNGDFDFND